MEERFSTDHELDKKAEEINELLRRLDEETEKLRKEPNSAAVYLENARKAVEEMVRRGELKWGHI
jgi:hypothetical protein